MGKVGRPRTFTPEAVARILALRQAGLGTRSITTQLLRASMWATRGTVRRVLRGEKPYDAIRDSG